MIDPSAQKLLSLIFDDGEKVCVSPNQYGYVAIEQDGLLGETVFLTQNDGTRSREYATKTLGMVCINPVNGARTDQNVVLFRSFLVEIDSIPLEDQIKYVNDMKLPYTAAIYSGNRSIHFIVSLKEPIKNIDEYKFYGKWILRSMEKSDQGTYPPSRSTRIPGVVRPETGKKQVLIETRDRVDNEVLFQWLSQFPDKKPVLEESKPRIRLDSPASIDAMPRWVQAALISGPTIVGGSRNKTWFGLACELGKFGYSEDEAIDLLSSVFTPETDFGTKEWETAIRSGVKHASK